MAVLADNTRLNMTFSQVDLESHNIVANDWVYERAILGFSSGTVRPLTAGDSFAGFSAGEYNNTGGSAGDIRVEVIARATIHGVTVAGASGVASMGAPVYATNDNHADLTLTIGSNSKIGHICGYDPVSGTWSVHCIGFARRALT